MVKKPVAGSGDNSKAAKLAALKEELEGEATSPNSSVSSAAKRLLTIVDALT